MMIKVCKISTCTEKFLAKGYCRAHYEQVRVNGYITRQFVSKNTGKTKHPLYATWQNMLVRCYRKNNPHYKNYGGRGIKVCERWRNKTHKGFNNFLEDMGERPEGMTLDRIDVNGNYEPSNCKWSTRQEQMLNTRVSTDTPNIYLKGYRKDGTPIYQVVNNYKATYKNASSLREAQNIRRQLYA